MKKIKKSDISALVNGSLFYGTGGGGSHTRARQILLSMAKNKSLPSLVGPQELQNNGVCITCFSVGTLRADVISSELMRTMLTLYQGTLNQTVQAIIPVEIGPLSLAVSMQLASILRLPIVDADVVGGRSTPEVFLETITLFSIRRTPLLVFNAQGKFKILTKNVSYQKEEQFLRSFAAKSGGFAYVFGYPLTKRNIMRSIAQNTVSRTMQTGRMIQKKTLANNLNRIKAKRLFSGTIDAIQRIDQEGFSSKIVEMKNQKQKAKLYIKNENIIFWIDNSVALTCPDLIILVNNIYRPIFNEDIRIGMQVSVLGVQCVPLWRTVKGKRLFSPKTFGFSFRPKLL